MILLTAFGYAVLVIVVIVAFALVLRWANSTGNIWVVYLAATLGGLTILFYLLIVWRN